MSKRIDQKNLLLEGVDFWKDGFSQCPFCSSGFKEVGRLGFTIDIQCINPKCSALFKAKKPFGVELISSPEIMD